MTMSRWWLLLPGLLVLAACDKEKEVDPPAQLVEFKPKIKVDQVWSTGLGGTEALRLGLRPAVDAERLFVADHKGEVLALQARNGRKIWRMDTKLPLSGGPGAGFGRVVVGSVEGDVVALNAADGAELWRVHVGGEVLSSPAVAENVVVVRSVEGRLRGLDAKAGHELWMVEQPVPRLSLRGTAAPVIAGDVVICGFDNGKVLAVGLAAGDIVWETAVAPSRGRTELERLVDIDSLARVVDKDVFVVGFQGRAAMLALESGQIWWARDASSDRGLALGSDSIFISAANGDVIALRRRDGAPIWEQAALHQRHLSAPVVDGNTIVVADFEGYVHWLDAATGEIVARRTTDGARVTNAPVVADGMVFVLTDGGKLSAFRRIEKSAAQPG
jgi:outer membrane protein assembly factor BamB